ncbi:hypothetical protein CDL15_Pgr014998 [Punica granatum]|uniref:Uncharacterized protein n=1 Tax=Punica granatum TaxID=22663 RepID=A0A218X0C5_PUNGR|nr:hypothetical protein CDL15_Pgr014998 [Punica granatum]
MLGHVSLVDAQGLAERCVYDHAVMLSAKVCTTRRSCGVSWAHSSIGSVIVLEASWRMGWDMLCSLELSPVIFRGRTVGLECLESKEVAEKCFLSRLWPFWIQVAFLSVISCNGKRER